MPLLLMLWLSVVPKGVILVKGATPSASDASTPVPEQGTVAGGRYRNAYFGLSYPIPAGWSEQPAGPPPSDGGSYALAQFAVDRANVLLSAQDLFFGAHSPRDALAPPAPLCVRDYGEVVEKRDPLFTTHRFNTIPVRVIVDAKGRVRHVHLLNAFPEQSQAILAALRNWRFKPYRVGGRAVAVETGMVFGMPPMSPPAAP